MRTRVVLLCAVLTALSALPIADTAAPVAAKKRARIVTKAFHHAAEITIPYSATSPVAATPNYPATITVSGVKNPIRDVNVRFNDVSHSWPDDVEVLLVGPEGQTAVVMANVGDDIEVEGLRLRLDDEAAAALPDDDALTSGVFRPTNATGGVIAFNAPAPAADANAALSVFDGADPNGAWQLFVQDEYGLRDFGEFAGAGRWRSPRESRRRNGTGRAMRGVVRAACGLEEPEAVEPTVRGKGLPRRSSSSYDWTCTTEPRGMDLLEREPHLPQLEEHRQQAAAGHGRLVLVGGEAGVGKTSLVDAFCRRTADAAAVLRTSCDALSTPSPLGWSLFSPIP